MCFCVRWRRLDGSDERLPYQGRRAGDDWTALGGEH